MEKSDSQKSVITKIERYAIDSKIDEDQNLKIDIDHYLSIIDFLNLKLLFFENLIFIILEILEKESENILGYCDFELDGRFCNVRVSESIIGNFICDIMKKVVENF